MVISLNSTENNVFFSCTPLKNVNYTVSTSSIPLVKKVSCNYKGTR